MSKEMILTGKAKEDFFEFMNMSLEEEWKFDLEPNHTNTDIIEWLDSVGIYLNISFVEPYGYFMYFIHRNGWTVNETAIKDRITATQKAIAKANEIYNS